MRILMITSAYPANTNDSRGIFIHELARSLVDEGASVTVLAPGARSAPGSETRDGVKVQRATYWIPRWQALAEGVGGIVPNLRQNPLLLLQVPSLIVALIWRALTFHETFDIIHAHWIYPAGLAGWLASKVRSTPLVVTSHGSDLNFSSRFQVLRVLSRFVTRRAAVCVGVSHAMVEAFKGLGVASSRVAFIPLGVDSKRVNDMALGEPGPVMRRYFDHTGLRIVYVGRLIPLKSVETLLKAHGELERRGHDIATLVVGSGPSENRLRAYVRDNDLKDVFFTGAQPPGSAVAYMSTGQVLVLPSRSEGRGLVLLEAMSLAIPVIASDIPGPRELVREGETGMLFPAGDFVALADRLEQLVLDSGLGRRLGDGGRRMVAAEGLSMQESARQHIELYTGLKSADSPQRNRVVPVVTLASRLRRHPLRTLSRGIFKTVVGRLRYSRGTGYDSERYWTDRFNKYGASLRGPGHEALSEQENATQYNTAALRLQSFCQQEGIHLAGASVLEIGCGTGFYTRLCFEAGVSDYTGIDVTGSRFADLRERFPSFRFLKADITAEPPLGSFDVILMIDVVEHIVEEALLERAMNHVRSALAPGGTFIISLPDVQVEGWSTSLFYLRFWPMAAIDSRFPGYRRSPWVPFRNGHLFAVQDPRFTAE